MLLLHFVKQREIFFLKLEEIERAADDIGMDIAWPLSEPLLNSFY